MPNPSKATNPLDYPRYVRGIRPSLPESLGQYVEDELEKLQNSVENLAVASDQNAQARVATETTTRITEDEVLASRIDTVEASLADVDADFTAAITTEQTARIAGDTALASSITSLTSTVSGNLSTVTAAISSEASTRASADSALTSSISSLSATVSGNYGTLSASISSEATARASGDSANASSISTLSTTVSGHTSTLSTYGSSISGLQAKYGVKLDVDGYVVGWELNNGGGSGDMVVRADKFAVGQPGASGDYPFQIVGGVTYIKNVMIQNASITTAKIDNLAVSTSKINDGATTNPKLADNAATQAGYFSNDFGLLRFGTTGAWLYLSDGVTWTAQVAGKSGSSSNQQIQILANVDFQRAGGDDDHISVRCIRDDGTVLPQVYDNLTIMNQHLTWNFIFIDPSPIPDSVHNYALQVYCLVDRPYYGQVVMSSNAFMK